MVNETLVSNPAQANNQNQEEEVKDSSLENISIENATYLQNLESTSDVGDENKSEDIPQFEVDSIELATPELFSEDSNIGTDTQENKDNNELNIFEDTSKNSAKESETIKEPEMFEENNQEEDFEIPAFLRRQKN